MAPLPRHRRNARSLPSSKLHRPRKTGNPRPTNKKLGGLSFAIGAGLLMLAATILILLFFAAIISPVPVKAMSVVSEECYFDAKLCEKPRDWWNPEHGVVIGIDLTGKEARAGVQRLKDGPVEVIPGNFPMDKSGIQMNPTVSYESIEPNPANASVSVDLNSVAEVLSRVKRNAEVYMNGSVNSALIATTYQFIQQDARATVEAAARLAGFNNSVFVRNYVHYAVRWFAMQHEGWLANVTKGWADILFLSARNFPENGQEFLVDLALIEAETDLSLSMLVQDIRNIKIEKIKGVEWYLEEFLKENDANVSAIDGAILTGTWSSLEEIQALLRKNFGITHISTMDDELAVVGGTAGQAGDIGHMWSCFDGLICDDYRAPRSSLLGNEAVGGYCTLDGGKTYGVDICSAEDR